MDWTNKTVLVTGGTGSFGKKFIKILLEKYNPAKVIVFSRDELKQHEMRVAGFNQENLRYFIGDVRDLGRLRRAVEGVDIVVHAAALKQVPACEYNPIEAIKTNIEGTSNVVEAALDSGVRRVLMLSTDKAVSPANLYGATKLAAEKLTIQSNAYAGGRETRFSCVRYGNVVGSRGSVVPVFLRQRDSGKLTITDARMTRFWLSLEQGVNFVINAIEKMYGGEVFVPKIPSTTIPDLAKAIAPDAELEVIGIRPGEKLHEVLISEDEARSTIELEDMYVVQPATSPWFGYEWESKGNKVPEGFRYASDTNTEWLSVDEIKEIVNPIEKEFLAGKLS
ncbi:MAG: UDP-N-acetylglucosamine 4,6-dehydratase (inverting) [Chloroflexi bacterium]|nr:UDP-N-acetylglucosamine 4,6-dehydratase (inverting) [Chloroflexota bacterium]MBT3670061.1 UDP-N-acetylglucosamine 4,6-dehydratase (inverting) [Chloroflexota bacterium]MBT4002212.1 UDP-N-acetylglucosamine 4,6-dehydratase (inverting) [Chloroflexota bacterium]MBT4306737.1 UDP-N-acetylglucosamine 4,6-dehydratase (inverting) [Chloroflexota bacterium]MBT4532947.1 UDP-N-acetylglucosamine 4,6-dehydratase (inverting) [Chloroflexota bacterium]